MTLDELRERFLRTSFCPSRLIRGREETPICFTALRIESHPATENEYASNPMFNVLTYMDGTTKPASVPFADWSTKDDAEFIRDVVEWFRKDSRDED